MTPIAIVGRPAPRPVAVRLLLPLLVLVLSLAVVISTDRSAAATTYKAIQGTGSSWSAIIVKEWASDVSANGIQVTYTATGSSAGRKAFANGTSDFGITEVPYQGVGAQGGDDPAPKNRPFSYVPIVAGGTSFSYQVKANGKLVKNIRLSGETIAKIFTNKITNWNDPQITKDNNGRKLPSLRIRPVVRSDGSGTTAQLTTWFDDQYPGIWRPFYGRSGLTSYFPVKGNATGANGSDQVMNTISAAAGNGTIGYVEYSYPRNKHYPVVKLLNSSGYFVQPTQYNVAVALTKAVIRKDLTQDLRGVYRSSDPRAYPLSSYSYLLLPTGKNDPRMSTGRRQSLSDFLYYSLCQGQSKAGDYGYSPLPLNLVQSGFQELSKLKKADPKVDQKNRNVTKCNNPTFVPGNLKANKLAQIAAQPAACDKVGAGPCGGSTVGSNGKGGGDDGGGGGGGGGASGSGGGGDDDAAAGGGGTIDPETGMPVGSAGDGGGAASVAVQTELTAGRAGDDQVFGTLAVAELLAIIAAPGVIAVLSRRRAQRLGGRR